MKAELPDETGTNVISIEVIRKSRAERRMREECTHSRVIADTALNTIECSDCHKELNPIEWVASMAEQWTYVKRLTDQYKAAAEKYEKRSRTTCQHCHKMTRISE